MTGAMAQITDQKVSLRIHRKLADQLSAGIDKLLAFSAH
jgi:hypothetical protein